VDRTETNSVKVGLISKVSLPDIVIDDIVSWNDAQPDSGEVIASRYGLLLPEEGTKGTAKIVAALLPDLFCTVNAAKQAKVLIERLRHHYHTVRPHSSLGYKPYCQSLMFRPTPLISLGRNISLNSPNSNFSASPHNGCRPVCIRRYWERCRKLVSPPRTFGVVDLPMTLTRGN